MTRISVCAILLTATLASSGCALFEDQDRPRASVQEDDFAAYAAMKNGSSDAYDELGLQPSKRLSDEERESLEKRIRLKRLEQTLISQKAREQYYNFKSSLDSDDERIIFLQLPTIEARDRYAIQKGIYFRSNKYLPQVRDAVKRNDIVLGMTKEAVLESWGEPEDVEVAGNSLYGNERWKYIEFVSTQEGFQREERMVIFESGKVVGWKLN
jgi:hypothetical protein